MRNLNTSIIRQVVIVTTVGRRLHGLITVTLVLKEHGKLTIAGHVAEAAQIILGIWAHPVFLAIVARAHYTADSINNGCIKLQ